MKRPLFYFILLLCVIISSANIQEPYTKHSYKPELDDFRRVSLAGVGVRWKKFGPIRAKVYSAGIYVDKSATILKKQGLKPKDGGKFDETNEFQQIFVEEDLTKSILLRMAREVGADTMISALSDSIKPRIGADLDALKKFEAILSESLAGGKVKNDMTFRFDSTANGALNVLINGATKGSINSKPLIKALFGTYLDKNTVAPTLKENVGANVLKW